MVDTLSFTSVNNLVYNVDMPINTEKTKVIQTVVTIEEYQRILEGVAATKKAGRKTTVSKYVANILRECWQTEDFFTPTPQ